METCLSTLEMEFKSKMGGLRCLELRDFKVLKCGLDLTSYQIFKKYHRIAEYDPTSVCWGDTDMRHCRNIFNRAEDTVSRYMQVEWE